MASSAYLQILSKANSKDLAGFTVNIEISVDSFCLKTLVIYKTKLIKLLNSQNGLLQLQLTAVRWRFR